MFLNVDMFGLIGLHKKVDRWIVAFPNERYDERRRLVPPHQPLIIIPKDIVEDYNPDQCFMYECEDNGQFFVVVDLQGRRFSIDMAHGTPGRETVDDLLSISKIIHASNYLPCGGVSSASVPLGQRLKSRGELIGGSMHVLAYSVMHVGGSLHYKFDFRSVSGGLWGSVVVPDAVRYRAEFTPGEELNLVFSDLSPIKLRLPGNDQSIYICHPPVFRLKSQNHLHALFDLMVNQDTSPEVQNRMFPSPATDVGEPLDPIQQQISRCIQDLLSSTFGTFIPSNLLSCPLVKIP